MIAAQEAGAEAGGLSDRDFKRLATLVEHHLGIRMPLEKKTMLAARVARRVRALSLPGFAPYCDLLEGSGEDAPEMGEFLDLATTNMTSFFREPHHFDQLVAEALPAVWAQATAQGRREVTIWSAASSTGEEVWTLAMLAEEQAARSAGVGYSLLGTDICTRVLRRAVRAVYPEEAASKVPEALRRKYFLRSRDRGEALVRVTPQLRARATFGVLNLMGDEYDVPTMDVVFCRNVLIYFPRETQEAVVAKLARRVRPGGYLFLGSTESVRTHDLPLKSVGRTTYRRL